MAPIRTFCKKWKHLRIHGNFLETSKFCPKRSPMSLFAFLVDQEGRFQVIEAIRDTWGQRYGPKKAF